VKSVKAWSPAITKPAKTLFPRKLERGIDRRAAHRCSAPALHKRIWGLRHRAQERKGSINALRAASRGCGPPRGRARWAEVASIFSQISVPCTIQHKVQTRNHPTTLETKNGAQRIYLCSTLSAMLQDFIGPRTSGLLVPQSTGRTNSSIVTRCKTSSIHLESVSTLTLGSTSSGAFGSALLYSRLAPPTPSSIFGPGRHKHIQSVYVKLLR